MEEHEKNRKSKDSQQKSQLDKDATAFETEDSKRIKSEAEQIQSEKVIEEQQNEQKSKAKKEPLDGIALLKEIGLKNVSNKTFINLQNLTHLLNKDFEKLHKTKALGFIQILERDFKVDLKELREDYLAYLNGGRRIARKHTLSKLSQTKSTSPSSLESESPKIKLGPIILLLLASGLLYYLYHTATDDEEQIEVGNATTENMQIESQDREDSLIADAIEDDGEQKKASDENSSDDDLELNKIVHKMLNQEKRNEENSSGERSMSAIKTMYASEIDSQDTPVIKEKPEDKVTNEDEKAIAPVIEKNIPDENILNNESKTNSSEVSSLPPLSKIENGMVEQKELESKKEEKIVSQSKKIKAPKVDKAITPSLKIVPIEKAWVGVIYLDDLTKKDYLIRNALKLDPNRDQIILVGHNKFKIYNHGKNKPFHSKKMVRFLYQGGVLREIDKQEYLNLSDGVRW